CGGCGRGKGRCRLRLTGGGCAQGGCRRGSRWLGADRRGGGRTALGSAVVVVPIAAGGQQQHGAEGEEKPVHCRAPFVFDGTEELQFNSAVPDRGKSYRLQPSGLKMPRDREGVAKIGKWAQKWAMDRIEAAGDDRVGWWGGKRV